MEEQIAFEPAARASSAHSSEINLDVFSAVAFFFFFCRDELTTNPCYRRGTLVPYFPFPELRKLRLWGQEFKL